VSRAAGGGKLRPYAGQVRPCPYYNRAVGNLFSDSLHDRYFSVLTDRGLKITRPRRALIERLLQRPSGWFQAELLLTEINSGQPGTVSRATVYRTLDLLVEAGVLMRELVGDNRYRYDRAQNPGESEHQLVDLKTGRSLDIAASPSLKRALGAMCAEQNFSELYHVVKIFGEFGASESTAPPRRRAARSTAKGKPAR
jgi:Fur family ferric uptake transcriptional regulator